MPAIPLLSHTDAEQTLAWQHDTAISVHQFLTDVQQVAALLLEGKYLLNMCSDRYRFTVGLAAAISSNKTSLLPPTHTPEMIRQLKCYAPDVFCLSDQPSLTLDLPMLQYPVAPVLPGKSYAVPLIDSTQCVAMVFTSGSTGIPQPHAKTWGALAGSVQAEATRLGLMNGISHTLIGTVPPQHMYGLESTVLMALQSGNIISSQQPFYPADICAAIAAAPLPRVLISSPVHLRALLDSALKHEVLSLVISATAPLSIELAHAVEDGCKAPLLEIYGSTETGLIATRRPAVDREWQLLPGISLTQQDGKILVAGTFIQPPMVMNDIIELTDEDRFLLHGRTADLINIAGKRNSLDNLNHQLTSIPGVIDGVFYMPTENSHDHVTRLTAFVVAPGCNAAQILAALRERIDPAFLPRPLFFVDNLPRNGTGKLTLGALQTLLHKHRAKAFS